jgi:hypothetical protein
LPGKILAVADLILPAVADDLIENAELVANAVPERGHFDRRERVHVTRRESAQPAIAEAGLFFLRKNLVQIVAEPAHRFARGANDLYQEARNRGHALSVVGVPKTIDNDVGFVSRTFGFFTAVEEGTRVLDCAHTEERSVPGGIGLVKLMGRHAGFITAGAVVAGQDVNFALIPEVPFEPAAFLAALKQRMLLKSHAVIAVGEGAGQDLLAADASARDASGNLKLKDIGPFLRQASRSSCVTSTRATRSAAVRRTARTRYSAIPSRATPSTPQWPARLASSSAFCTSVSSTSP